MRVNVGALDFGVRPAFTIPARHFATHAAVGGSWFRRRRRVFLAAIGTPPFGPLRDLDAARLAARPDSPATTDLVPSAPALCRRDRLDFDPDFHSHAAAFMSPPCFFTTACQRLSVGDLMRLPVFVLSIFLLTGLRKIASIMVSPCYPMMPRGVTDKPGPVIRTARPHLCAFAAGAESWG